MHKLLARQLRRTFGSEEAVPEALAPFIAAVEAAYRQADEERTLAERSMEIVSHEMIERFDRLSEAVAERERSAERALGAERLNRALSVLQATFESTADGILVTDRDNRNMQANRKFAELWRIPDEMLATIGDGRVRARMVEQVVDVDAFLAKPDEVRQDPAADSFDVLHLKDGRVFERLSLPQRLDGDIVGRVWSYRDITARRALEEQFRQSQKMEAVGTLAGGIAHDFNNLLTVIGLHAEFLTGTIDAARPERVDVDEIVKAGELAASLTRQLLAFSRKQILQPVVLDVSRLATGLDAMLRRLVGEHIVMTTIADPDVGNVTADPGQLDQVLMNLVVNARDAMSGGGQLTIRTSNVTLTRDFPLVRRGICPPGPFVTIAVSDTGVGIPAAARDRIFEPFFTTKEPGKGTGLGLSTVYGIVKQSGGYIWVDSVEGAGTTFTVYLPRTFDARVRTPVPTPTQTSAIGSETILLVEDEDEVRKLTRRILVGQGYTVIEACDGLAALGVAANTSTRIDLVVTDVVMPEVGGPEMIARMRVMRPGIPALYMSGYTDVELDRSGRASDAWLLQKPFTMAALTERVRTVLDGVGTGERAAVERRARHRATEPIDR